MEGEIRVDEVEIVGQGMGRVRLSNSQIRELANQFDLIDVYCRVNEDGTFVIDPNSEHWPEKWVLVYGPLRQSVKLRINL